MEDLKVKKIKELKEELMKLRFIDIEDLSGNFLIKIKCKDDWFVRWRKLNLLAGYNAEEKEIKFVEKLETGYITLDQLIKFLTIVEKYGDAKRS